jgi:hypothetical protein
MLSTLLMILKPETPQVLKLLMLKEMFRVSPLSMKVDHVVIQNTNSMLLQCAQQVVKMDNYQSLRTLPLVAHAIIQLSTRLIMDALSSV